MFNVGDQGESNNQINSFSKKVKKKKRSNWNHYIAFQKGRKFHKIIAFLNEITYQKSIENFIDEFC